MIINRIIIMVEVTLESDRAVCTDGRVVKGMSLLIITLAAAGRWIELSYWVPGDNLASSASRCYNICGCALHFGARIAYCGDIIAPASRGRRTRGRQRTRMGVIQGIDGDILTLICLVYFYSRARGKREGAMWRIWGTCLHAVMMIALRLGQ